MESFLSIYVLTLPTLRESDTEDDTPQPGLSRGIAAFSPRCGIQNRSFCNRKAGVVHALESFEVAADNGQFHTSRLHLARDRNQSQPVARFSFLNAFNCQGRQDITLLYLI